MITVNLRVFASLKDICGYSEKTITLQKTMDIKEFLELFIEENPSLAEKRNSLLVALNEEYIPLNTLIKDKDTIAIFPPVSGG